MNHWAILGRPAGAATAEFRTRGGLPSKKEPLPNVSRTRVDVVLERCGAPAGPSCVARRQHAATLRCSLLSVGEYGEQTIGETAMHRATDSASSDTACNRAFRAYVGRWWSSWRITATGVGASVKRNRCRQTGGRRVVDAPKTKKICATYWDVCDEMSGKGRDPTISKRGRILIGIASRLIRNRRVARSEYRVQNMLKAIYRGDDSCSVANRPVARVVPRCRFEWVVTPCWDSLQNRATLRIGPRKIES